MDGGVLGLEAYECVRENLRMKENGEADVRSMDSCCGRHIGCALRCLDTKP